MKTLYVSDLDGTLLNHEGKLSQTTIEIIKDVVSKGGLFSFATARSYQTSHKITQALDVNIPIIVYNGTFVMNQQTKEIIIGNFFNDDIKEVIRNLFHHGISMLVYHIIDGVEYFSFLKDQESEGMKKFLSTRLNDPRWREVQGLDELLKGDIFYINCIDEKEKLWSFYEKYQNNYHCLYEADIYTKAHMFEIMPQHVSKASAILQLKDFLHCDHVICFGDGKNDLDMFKVADEAYAVRNACEELKALATDVIGSNDEDSVAKFIQKRFLQKQ